MIFSLVSSVLRRGTSAKKRPARRVMLSLAVLGAAVFLQGTALAEEAPDFTLRDLAGREVRLSSFKGKQPVLLAFSASWCPYCRRQAPKVVALRNELKEEEIAILGVNQKESRDRAAEFAEAFELNYPTLLDKNGAVSDRYEVEGIPYFVLIDRNGQVRATGHDVGGLRGDIRAVVGKKSGE